MAISETPKNEQQKANSEKPKTAIARGVQIPISTKHAVMLARFIRYKPAAKAKRMLESVIDQKIAVPFPRFNFDLGHKKPGLGPAQYPIKAASAMLSLLNSAEKNAANNGLDANSLVISACIANKGIRHWHTGRKRRQKMKRTSLFIELREKEVSRALPNQKTKKAGANSKKQRTNNKK